MCLRRGEPMCSLLSRNTTPYVFFCLDNGEGYIIISKEDQLAFLADYILTYCCYFPSANFFACSSMSSLSSK